MFVLMALCSFLVPVGGLLVRVSAVGFAYWTLLSLVIVSTTTAQSDNCTCWDYCLQILDVSDGASMQEARDVCRQAGGDISMLASLPETSLTEKLMSEGLNGNSDIDLLFFGLYYDGTHENIFDPWTYYDKNVSDYLSADGVVDYDFAMVPYCTVLEKQNQTGAVELRARKIPCCFSPPGFLPKHVLCKIPANDTGCTIEDPDDTLLDDTCFSNCEAGWHHYNNACYRSFMSNGTGHYGPATIYEARQMCFSYNADLVNVTNSGEELHVALLMNEEAYGSNFWSGMLIDASSNGNSYGDFSPIAGVSVNDLGKHCAKLSSTDGNLAYQSTDCCDLQMDYFICKKDEGATTINIPPTEDDVSALICYEDKDDCPSHLCVYGNCTDGLMNYTCDCEAGITGEFCETIYDWCVFLPDICINGGTCVSTGGEYNCTCVEGYGGQNCSDVIDYCLVFQPCVDENTDDCTHTGTNPPFTCVCKSGFTDANCSTNINDCLSNMCENGGTCEDGIANYTCLCPSITTGVYCETEVSCPPFNVTDFGDATITEENKTEFATGDIVTVACTPGYKFSDGSTTKNWTCESAGWTPVDMDRCARHCEGDVPEVLNALAKDGSGTIISDITSAPTEVGSKLLFQCLEGHKFDDNSTSLNITCMDDTNWSIKNADVPHCNIIRCPELPQDTPNQVLKTRTNTYSTTVIFYCEVGYVLHDQTTARTIKCQGDGQWTASLPECSPVTCLPTQSFVYSTSNSTSTDYNTYVKHECTTTSDNIKRRMIDGATNKIIRCDANKQWSSEVTECEVNRCIPLPFVANTTTPSSTDATDGNKATVSCIAGHSFDDQNTQNITMTCDGSTGRWSGVQDGCKPVFCDELQVNLHSFPSTNETLYGTRVNVTCNKGHYFDVSDRNNLGMYMLVETECKADKTWTVPQFQPCWPVQCDAAAPVYNGTTDYDANDDSARNYSSYVNYECDDGFLFIDGTSTRQIQCLETGEWSLDDVSCRPDRCIPVPQDSNAPHSSPNTTDTVWFINVTYTCDVGYEWHNNKVSHSIMCNPTKAGEDFGSWTESSIPPCWIKNCTDLPSPPTIGNAAPNDTADHYGTVVRYTCQTGYKFGDDKRTLDLTCEDNKKWEPEDRRDSCQIIHCPELPSVENATRLSNETEFNVSVTYSCLPGYQFPDKLKNRTIVCAENETWSENPSTIPGCEVVFCPPVPTWNNAIFNSSLNDFGVGVSYSCDSGYGFRSDPDNPNAVKVATCLDTKAWDPPLEVCKSLESIAAELQDLAFEAEEAVSIGTIACSLLCVVVVAIIILDSHKLYSDLKIMKRNIASFIHSMRYNRVSNSNPNIQAGNA